MSDQSSISGELLLTLVSVIGVIATVCLAMQAYKYPGGFTIITTAGSALGTGLALRYYLFRRGS